MQVRPKTSCRRFCFGGTARGNIFKPARQLHVHAAAHITAPKAISRPKIFGFTHRLVQQTAMPASIGTCWIRNGRKPIGRGDRPSRDWGGLTKCWSCCHGRSVGMGKSVVAGRASSAQSGKRPGMQLQGVAQVIQANAMAQLSVEQAHRGLQDSKVRDLAWVPAVRAILATPCGGM